MPERSIAKSLVIVYAHLTLHFLKDLRTIFYRRCLAYTFRRLPLFSFLACCPWLPLCLFSCVLSLAASSFFSCVLPLAASIFFLCCPWLPAVFFLACCPWLPAVSFLCFFGCQHLFSCVAPGCQQFFFVRAAPGCQQFLSCVFPDASSFFLCCPWLPAVFQHFCNFPLLLQARNIHFAGGRPSLSYDVLSVDIGITPGSEQVCLRYVSVQFKWSAHVHKLGSE